MPRKNVILALVKNSPTIGTIQNLFNQKIYRSFILKCYAVVLDRFAGAPNCTCISQPLGIIYSSPGALLPPKPKENKMKKKNKAAVALGRLGGKTTSPAKAAASRANGAKGGRPRKSTLPTKP
jgi:hypothetical protein